VPAVIAKLRNLAPYAALELVMPGGSVMAILLWLYRRRKQQRHGPSNQAFNMDGPVPYLQSAPNDGCNARAIGDRGGWRYSVRSGRC
jgi:hypothetical protein